MDIIRVMGVNLGWQYKPGETGLGWISLKVSVIDAT